jgi:hypothetical protein
MAFNDFIPLRNNDIIPSVPFEYPFPDEELDGPEIVRTTEAPRNGYPLVLSRTIPVMIA